MSELVISQPGENFIKGYETCRLRAYLPTKNDRWTCGWGSTGPDIGPDTAWTQEQADTRFHQDMVRFAHGVWLLLHVQTSQQQFDALCSFAYNEGLTALAGSTLLKFHNEGDFNNAANQFRLWNKQRDKATGELIVLDGLTKRRAAEVCIYLSGIYNSAH